MNFRMLTTLRSKLLNPRSSGRLHDVVDWVRDRASAPVKGDRNIGQKLNVGFGVLVAITFLAIGRNYLGGRQAEVNINQTQELRVPTVLTSAQAQEHLLRMLSDVRAYLATGESEYRYRYQQARQSFERDLAQMEALSKNWSSSQSSQHLNKLKVTYQEWSELPDRLIELKDDLVENQPALHILDQEGQRPIIAIQREIAQMLDEQELRSPSAQNTALLRDMADFQSSFALLVSSLQTYLVTRAPSFRFEYQARAQENENAWKALVQKRAFLTPTQQSSLDAMRQQREAFMKLPKRMFEAVDSPQYRQDLYLFQTRAEPLAASMLALLDQIVTDQQSILARELRAGSRSLSQAQWQTLLGGVLALILGLAMAVALRQQIAEPIKRLTEATSRIKDGDLDAKAPVDSNDEIGKLAESFNSMAAQLQESFATLAKQNEELKHLDQLKDEFLANTSHELRTPLNGIIGIAESLIDGATGELSAATRFNLVTIVSSGRRLSNLVNDILDFSQLRHKHLELQLKSVDLWAVTEVVLTLSQPLIAKKNLQLINAIPTDLSLALADENRLQQILHNLIGNAIKFTSEGTVTISALLSSSSSNIEITVSDTGIGIPEDKIERIFESFEQAEGSTAREYGGTGLGLAVTKQLVELHGGQITVHSQVNQGSHFRFTLPIAQGNQEELTSSVDVLKNSLSPSFIETAIAHDSSPTISENQQAIQALIVDDEPINLQVLVNNLSLHNYAITQVNNGQEALDLIANGLKPDIVLLDVMMPKMTGYEVTQKLRERFNPTELPIILLTAKTQVQDIVTGLNIGANDYLTKPIAKDELLARIRTHLHLKQLKDENMRLAAEVEVVKKMQQMVLPKPLELESVTDLEIAGFMEPADEVGGDYYDILPNQSGIKIGIGDVTGHGLESGIVMLMAQTAVRTLQESNQTDPVQFMDILNRTIYRNVQRINPYLYLTLSVLDYAEGNLKIMGQHEEIIVVRQSGEVEKIDTINLGFPIGLEEEISEFIAQEQVPLNSGDVVVLYTDGITEAFNLNQDEYGLERLCEQVKFNCEKSAREIKQAVIADVRRHIGKQKVFDDITLVVLKKK